jgi:hypothetical protein
MLEDLLKLFRETEQAVATSPAAAQATADVKALEGIAAKHAEEAESWAAQHATDVENDVRNFLISRLHPEAAAQVGAATEG